MSNRVALSERVSGYQTPAEEREAREARAVALAQPHRRGNEDVRAGSPLWEACSRLGLRDELYEAGEQYGKISRDYKLTIDIRANGHEISAGGLTDADRDARAKLAKDRYWKAINVLRRAHPMAQGIIERVCYDLCHLGFHEEAPFKKGLYSLAIDFRTLTLGINDGKEH